MRFISLSLSLMAQHSDLQFGAWLAHISSAVKPPPPFKDRNRVVNSLPVALHASKSAIKVTAGNTIRIFTNPYGFDGAALYDIRPTDYVMQGGSTVYNGSGVLMFRSEQCGSDIGTWQQDGITAGWTPTTSQSRDTTVPTLVPWCDKTVTDCGFPSGTANVDTTTGPYAQHCGSHMTVTCHCLESTTGSYAEGVAIGQRECTGLGTLQRTEPGAYASSNNSENELEDNGGIPNFFIDNALFQMGSLKTVKPAQSMQGGEKKVFTVTSAPTSTSFVHMNSIGENALWRQFVSAVINGGPGGQSAYNSVTDYYKTAANLSLNRSLNGNLFVTCDATLQDAEFMTRVRSRERLAGGNMLALMYAGQPCVEITAISGDCIVDINVKTFMHVRPLANHPNLEQSYHIAPVHLTYHAATFTATHAGTGETPNAAVLDAASRTHAASSDPIVKNLISAIPHKHVPSLTPGIHPQHMIAAPPHVILANSLAVQPQQVQHTSSLFDRILSGAGSAIASVGGFIKSNAVPLLEAGAGGLAIAEGRADIGDRLLTDAGGRFASNYGIDPTAGQLAGALGSYKYQQRQQRRAGGMLVPRGVGSKRTRGQSYVVEEPDENGNWA